MRNGLGDQHETAPRRRANRHRPHAGNRSHHVADGTEVGTPSSVPSRVTTADK